MKKITFLVIALFLCGLSVQAQEKDKESDDTEINTEKDHDEDEEEEDEDYDIDDDDDGGFTIHIGKGWRKKKAENEEKRKRKKNVKTRWLMLDYGISTYTHNGKIDLPTDYEPLEQKLWGSNNWNLHAFQQRINLHQHKVNLMYGVTFEFNRYNFRNDYTIEQKTNKVNFLDTRTTDFEKNRLNATYLTVPLMLNFESSRKYGRSFRVNVGAYAGLLLTGRLKQESSEFGEVKTDDDFNLNKTRFGLTGRIGYGGINFFVNYGLSSLFDENERGNYDLKPLNFGISIIPF